MRLAFPICWREDAVEAAVDCVETRHALVGRCVDADDELDVLVAAGVLGREIGAVAIGSLWPWSIFSLLRKAVAMML
jgi:hypothetical protein